MPGRTPVSQEYPGVSDSAASLPASSGRGDRDRADESEAVPGSGVEPYRPTLLRLLIKERHWQIFRTFETQFARAAREIAERDDEPKLANVTVSLRQWERWYSGAVRTEPHPNACRVLEHMFGYSIEELLSPATPQSRTAGQRASESSDADVAFKALIRQRHLSYEAFCREWDRVATPLDPVLKGRYPGRAQYYRWLRGDLANRRPYPDACRILEAMFPGWPVEKLFSPYIADGPGSSGEAFAAMPDVLGPPGQADQPSIAAGGGGHIMPGALLSAERDCIGCGRPLSRYNPEDYCQSCHRQAIAQESGKIADRSDRQSGYSDADGNDAPEMPDGGFGIVLSRLIEEHGISVREVARRVPCNPGYISNLSNGVKRPSHEMAARLDAVLGANGDLIARVPEKIVTWAVPGTQARQEVADQAGKSGGLPPSVMARPDFKAACESRDLGRILEIAVKWGGAEVSISQVARRCNMSIGQVQDYIKRGRKAHDVNIWERVADGLLIPGEMVGIGRRRWEGANNAGGESVAYARSTPRIVAAEPSAALLPGMEAMSDAYSCDPSWQTAELVRRLGHSDTGTRTIELLTETVNGLCCEYTGNDAFGLHASAGLWLDRITRTLEGRTTLAEHRELLTCAGWVFLLRGCLEYDLGWHGAAETSRIAALQIGREAGHGEIEAWAWELAAWFALTQGRVGDATAYAAAGTSVGKGKSVAVQLYGQQAKAAARMNNASEVRNALKNGYALLNGLPRPTYARNHFIVDPDKWGFYEMDAYRQLRDDERAAANANEIIRAGTGPAGEELSPMRMAEARLTLGIISARSGELEYAVNAGAEALRTERKSLPSLLLVAGELNGELSSRYPREPIVQEYSAKLARIRRATFPEIKPSSSDGN